MTVAWEHGSDPPLVPPDRLLPVGTRSQPPWLPSALLVSTGRDALVTLLAFGRDRHGWRRVWLPSYFCQSVVRAAGTARLELASYPSRPGLAGGGLADVAPRPGDVIVTFGHFGLCRTPSVPAALRTQVTVVEDHSHDPWSPEAYGSDADYCLASLRKTLPLPDGGVLWSPRDLPLPAAPQLWPDRSAAALERLQAMALKAVYLAGRGVDKSVYRGLFAAAEARFSSGRPASASSYSTELLARLPVVRWRRQRRENHATFLAALSDELRPAALVSDGSGAAPCVCVLVLPAGLDRDALRARLADRGVYAAAHWPLADPALPGLAEEDRSLSERIVTLQCDARYGAEDMTRVAALLSEAVRRVGR